MNTLLSHAAPAGREAEEAHEAEGQEEGEEAEVSEDKGRLLVPRASIVFKNSTQSVQVTIEFPNHTMESDEEFREALTSAVALLQSTFRQARYSDKKALAEDG